MGLGYSGSSLEGPLRRFMARVPRIMARLVRPTPTWQLKSRAGRGLDLSRPRPRLGLSWKSGQQKTGEGVGGGQFHSRPNDHQSDQAMATMTRR